MDLRLFLFIVWTLAAVTTALWSVLNIANMGFIIGTVIFIAWMIVSHAILKV
jgi:hypothetical protein